MMCRELELGGIFEITPARHLDERGYFCETWSRRALLESGIDISFVQDNQSLSVAAGTLRGLHFQAPPFAQTKLVRVVSGAIFDVLVDIRKFSPTYGKWVGIELSRDRGNQLFVPGGFAHGFLTLLPDTEVPYKASAYYSPQHARAIRFDDPAIGVPWPRRLAPFHISASDKAAPLLSEMAPEFIYGE